MYSRTVLIRALSCIANHGYTSKTDAMITEKESTASMVERMLVESPSTTDDEETIYGKEADEILDWVIDSPATDDYMKGCKWAINTADYEPDKVYGYICSLVTGYQAHKRNMFGMEYVTSPNTFAAVLGDKIQNLRCMCISSGTRYKGKRRICLVSDTGCLIVYYIPFKNISAIPHIMTEYYLDANVTRHKFTTPFETVVSNVALRLLDSMDMI